MRSLSAACSTALKNFIRKAVFSRTQPFIRAVPIGYHVHDGESETYYILSGRGIFNDNGTVVEVGPGDVTFTGDGEGHSIEATGDEPIEMIALILYR